MLVDLKNTTLILFEGSDALKNRKLQENYLIKIRSIYIQLFVECYDIKNYHSFKKLINTISPYQDDVEIERFWKGWFFSETFCEFIGTVIKNINEIDITPFQTKTKLR